MWNMDVVIFITTVVLTGIQVKDTTTTCNCINVPTVVCGCTHERVVDADDPFRRVVNRRIAGIYRV